MITGSRPETEAAASPTVPATHAGPRGTDLTDTSIPAASTMASMTSRTGRGSPLLTTKARPRKKAKTPSVDLPDFVKKKKPKFVKKQQSAKSQRKHSPKREF